MKIGQGIDVHQLVAGRRLILGGVDIPFDRGLEGHSDGDALLHAIADAILGALGEGDLGRHFPSSDERWRGADSRQILRETMAMARERGFAVGNLDATIVAQVPRLAPFQASMRENVATCLGAPPDRVNIKVTSTDRLGMIGREEGILAQALILLEPLASR